MCILRTCPCQISYLSSTSSITVFLEPILSFRSSLLILYIREILNDFLLATISVAATFFFRQPPLPRTNGFLSISGNGYPKTWGGKDKEDRKSPGWKAFGRLLELGNSRMSCGETRGLEIRHRKTTSIFYSNCVFLSNHKILRFCSAN